MLCYIVVASYAWLTGAVSARGEACLARRGWLRQVLLWVKVFGHFSRQLELLICLESSVHLNRSSCCRQSSSVTRLFNFSTCGVVPAFEFYQPIPINCGKAGHVHVLAKLHQPETPTSHLRAYLLHAQQPVTTSTAEDMVVTGIKCTKFDTSVAQICLIGI